MHQTDRQRRASIRKEGVSYVHIAEAARLLSCSEQYVRAECDRGALRGRIVGGAWHVEEENLAPYVKMRVGREEKRRAEVRLANQDARASLVQKVQHAKRIVGSEIRRRQ